MYEIENFLADKIKQEKKRLKSYGNKANSLANSVSIACSIGTFVQAFMAESRYFEIKRVLKWLDESASHRNGYTKELRQLQKKLLERKRELKIQKKAVMNMAVEKQEKSPWK